MDAYGKEAFEMTRLEYVVAVNNIKEHEGSWYEGDFDGYTESFETAIVAEVTWLREHTTVYYRPDDWSKIRQDQ